MAIRLLFVFLAFDFSIHESDANWLIWLFINLNVDLCRSANDETVFYSVKHINFLISFSFVPLHSRKTD